MRWLRKLGITRKKEYILQRARPAKVERYLQRMKDVPEEKRVYIDETGIDDQIYRQYARSPRGKRVKIGISIKRKVLIGLVAAQYAGNLYS